MGTDQAESGLSAGHPSRRAVVALPGLGGSVLAYSLKANYPYISDRVSSVSQQSSLGSNPEVVGIYLNYRFERFFSVTT